MTQIKKFAFVQRGSWAGYRRRKDGAMVYIDDNSSLRALIAFTVKIVEDEQNADRVSHTPDNMGQHKR